MQRIKLPHQLTNRWKRDRGASRGQGPLWECVPGEALWHLGSWDGTAVGGGVSGGELYVSSEVGLCSPAWLSGLAGHPTGFPGVDLWVGSDNHWGSLPPEGQCATVDMALTALLGSGGLSSGGRTRASGGLPVSPPTMQGELGGLGLGPASAPCGE